MYLTKSLEIEEDSDDDEEDEVYWKLALESRTFLFDCSENELKMRKACAIVDKKFETSARKNELTLRIVDGVFLVESVVNQRPQL